MFGLKTQIRWVLFVIGIVFISLVLAQEIGLGDDYPIIEILVFPYMAFVGLALLIIGYGIEQEPEKPNSSGGIDGAPGLGEKKGGAPGDNTYGDGDSGGDGGD